MGSRSKMYDSEGKLKTTCDHAYWGYAATGQEEAMKYATRRKFHSAKASTLKKLSKLRRIAAA